jgi:hypothetical protein
MEINCNFRDQSSKSGFYKSRRPIGDFLRSTEHASFGWVAGLASKSEHFMDKLE